MAYRVKQGRTASAGHRSVNPAPRSATGSRLERLLDLQQSVGNTAVRRLLSDQEGASPRLKLPPLNGSRSAHRPTSPGPTAVTFRGGRKLFDDGRGNTSLSEPAPMTKVATIVGSTLTKHEDDQVTPEPSGGADVEYDRTRPVVSGQSQEEQLDMVFEAVMEARRMLDAGFAGLMGVGSLPERSMDALDQNFNNVDRSGYPTRVSHLDEIRDSIAKTRAAFDQPIPVEIETSDQGRTLGYVKVLRIFGAYGNIHLLPRWFTKDANYRAQVIVHEACHRFDNDDDHAYRWDTVKYRNMSVEESTDNADSYAWFCDDVS
ncbi:MAG TPA: M35 family metallo-endopeptidase [Acidimicrobiales bacterium]|nr:M35 family metallo-endopeptidase [Acidimicrobiales bacterium]